MDRGIDREIVGVLKKSGGLVIPRIGLKFVQFFASSPCDSCSGHYISRRRRRVRREKCQALVFLAILRLRLVVSQVAQLGVVDIICVLIIFQDGVITGTVLVIGDRLRGIEYLKPAVFSAECLLIR